MPTDHKASFKLIEANYAQAAENYYRDMAAAKTEADAQSIDQNYKDAESAWAKALIGVMSRSSAQVEAAAKDLKAANDAVKAARAAHKAIGELTNKLKMATSIAGTLVRIAAV
jgi:hypothetical protein